jgi:protein-ribulosamine 3-kinase
MSELYKLLPSFVPKPYAWGELKDTAEQTYFFIMEFKRSTSGLPDPGKLGMRLAELHNRSSSLTGKFGFPLTTYDGALTQVVEWDSSWASFFSKLVSELTGMTWRRMDSGKS